MRDLTPEWLVHAQREINAARDAGERGIVSEIEAYVMTRLAEAREVCSSHPPGRTTCARTALTIRNGFPVCAAHAVGPLDLRGAA